MATFYAGKAGVITIGAVAHTAGTWSMTIYTEAVDITNFTSGGFVEIISGLSRAEVTVGGPYSSTVAFTVGSSVTVAPEVVSGTGFTMTAYCTQCKISTDVKGAAQFEATFNSTGTVTLAV